MIYAYVTPGPERVVDLTKSDQTEGAQKAFHLDILYTCQTIHTEAIPFLHRHCVFKLKFQDLVPVSCLWGCHTSYNCDMCHAFENFWERDPLSANVYSFRNRSVYYIRQLQGLTSPAAFSRLAKLEIAITLDMESPFLDGGYGYCAYERGELSESAKHVLEVYMHHFKLPMAHLNRLLRRFSNLVYLRFQITLGFMLPTLWCCHNGCGDPHCDGCSSCWYTEEVGVDCGCGSNDLVRAKLQCDGLEVLKEKGFFEEWDQCPESCENVIIECYVAENEINILQETIRVGQRGVDKADEASLVEVRITPFPSEPTSSTDSTSRMDSSSDDDTEVISGQYEPPRQLCGRDGHTPKPSCFCCCHCHCKCDSDDNEEGLRPQRYCRCNNTTHMYGNPNKYGQKDFYAFYRQDRHPHICDYIESLYCMPSDADSSAFGSAPCACWEANSHLHGLDLFERHDWENCQCDCHDDLRYKISWRDVVNEQLLHIDDFFPRLPNPNLKKEAFVEYDFGGTNDDAEDSDYSDTFSLTSDTGSAGDHVPHGAPWLLYPKQDQIPQATKQALLEVKNGVVCILK